MIFNYSKKIKIKPTIFNHHRDGWYNSASLKLYNTFNCPNGVVFYDWADIIFKNNFSIKSKWSGFLHNVINYPDKDYVRKYSGRRIYPLSKLVHQEFFKESIKNCCGIFTLSKHTADFLKDHVDCPVEHLLHPVGLDYLRFDFYKFYKFPKVATIGQWLRKFHSLFDLKTNYSKIIPKLSGYLQDYEEAKKYTANYNNVVFEGYKSSDQYDEMLSSSVVFLDLYDVAACNVVLECISRNTPILINKLQANVDYLGEEYPFYFSDLEEASVKINDMDLIEKTSIYLKSMDKSKLSSGHFIKTFAKSNIYRGIT